MPSNTDFSHTTLATQKSAQTVFAGALQATGDAAIIPSLVRMGGGAHASTAVHTTLGAATVGATKLGVIVSPIPVTTYTAAKAILAATVKKNNLRPVLILN
jgi:predicted alternative tryptophan synthase beta-subunit